MRQGIEELTATYSYTKNVFDDGTSIILTADGYTLKGKPSDPPLQRGCAYRFFGRWTTHPKYGRQFFFTDYVADVPSSREAVVHYLATHLKGVGHVTAGKLWDLYGPNVLDDLVQCPSAAIENRLLTPERAKEAVAFLQATTANRKTTLELLTLFNGRGFYRTIVGDCIDKWGPKSPDLIRDDPYILMVEGISGAGFKRCDAMYLDLGHDPAALRRQVMCLVHALRSDTSGSTWLTKDAVHGALTETIGGTAVRFHDATKEALEQKWISLRLDHEKFTWYADRQRAEDEILVANVVRQLLSNPRVDWPVVPGTADGAKPLSDHQRSELTKALKRPLAILVGTPGTGKTFAAAHLIRDIINLSGRANLAVCAPTGKAAVRLMESMAGNGVQVEATTIHRLLKYQPTPSGAMDFGYNKVNRLPQCFIVIDEASMCGTGLIARLFSALQPGAHVLLIGDKYQLPPVEHGAILRDLIDFFTGPDGACHYGELTEIRRNSGMIVEACRDIKDGQSIRTCSRFNRRPGDNLRLVPSPDPESTIAVLRRFMKEAQDSRKYDMLDDVQVICAVNAKSPLARKPLNRLLQAQLNPHGIRADPNVFRVNDKIICLKNGQMPLVDLHSVSPDQKVRYYEGDIAFPTDPGSYGKVQSPDSDKGATEYVANGEIGRVLAVGPKITIARFFNPDRLIKIPMGAPKEFSDYNPTSEEDSGTGCDFDLAYAVSCHKMQGSEARIIVVVIDDYPGAAWVCSREWWYTALSRAKDLCLLIGKRSTMERHCKRVFIRKRKTFLVELLNAPETNTHPVSADRSGGQQRADPVDLSGDSL